MTYAPVQLICFDLGRVLMQLRYGWSVACRAANVPLERDIDDATEAGINKLVCLHETGAMDNARFERELAALMGMTAEQAQATSTAWLAGPYPGAGELLDELAKLPVQTACLSNTNAHHWQIMCSDSHACALPMHRLDHRFASHLVGCRKPDAEIYEHVERATGIAPPAILFFDDKAENITAARLRGWQGVVVDDLHNPVRQMRDHLAALGVLSSGR